MFVGEDLIWESVLLFWSCVGVVDGESLSYGGDERKNGVVFDAFPFSEEKIFGLTEVVVSVRGHLLQA
jgi:hypothetical protein